MRPGFLLLFVLSILWLSTTPTPTCASGTRKSTREWRLHRIHRRRLQAPETAPPSNASGDGLTIQGKGPAPIGLLSNSKPWVGAPVVLGIASSMVVKGLVDLWHHYHHHIAATGISSKARPNHLEMALLYSVSHSDMVHFLVNLALTSEYGWRIERRYGSGRLLVLIASVMLGGGVINLVGCRFFDQCHGRGASGVSLSLVSAYACGHILDWLKARRPTRRKQRLVGAASIQNDMVMFLRCCVVVLLLELQAMDAHLSVWIHAYGMAAGALFALVEDA